MEEVKIKSLDFKSLYEKDEKMCDAVEKTLKHNPFAHIQDIPVEYYAEKQGKKVGSITIFPILVTADGKDYVANAGSGLFVSNEERGKGIGKKLAICRMNSSQDQISIGAGLSNMSYPLYKKLGCTFFISPRMGLVVNSKKIVHAFIGKLSVIVAPIINFFLFLISLPLYFKNKRIKNRYTICELDKACSEIENIVNEDEARFQEKHTKEWFDWLLNYNFKQNDIERNQLFAIKDRNGAIEAFFMFKTRIKKNIISSKTKDIRITSRIEWGIKIGSGLTEKDLVASFCDIAKKSNADIIEVSFLPKNTMRFLKKMGFIKMLDGRIMLYVGDESPLIKHEGWKREENWRLRPAYSDYGFC